MCFKVCLHITYLHIISLNLQIEHVIQHWGYSFSLASFSIGVLKVRIMSLQSYKTHDLANLEIFDILSWEFQNNLSFFCNCQLQKIYNKDERWVHPKFGSWSLLWVGLFMHHLAPICINFPLSLFVQNNFHFELLFVNSS